MTGGTGFVGSCLVPELVKRGYEVVCLVRSIEKGKKIFGDTVTFIEGDVTDPFALKAIPNNIEYAIHLAAVGHVSAVTEESYKLFVGVNESGTKNIIDELSSRKNFERFVHFSSTAAMGLIGIPIQDENSIPNPVTPYQKSKNRSEKIVAQAASEGFPTVVIRPCMIYGVGGYGEFYKFCRLMKKGAFPKVGLGKNLTPLVYVTDVVNAAILAMEKGTVGETYIVASESSIKMDDFRKLVVKSIGVRSPYFYVPAWVALFGAKLIELISARIGKEPIATVTNIRSTIMDRTFDISKAKKELGYNPMVNFEEGIKKTVEWYKDQGKL